MSYTSNENVSQDKLTIHPVPYTGDSHFDGGRVMRMDKYPSECEVGVEQQPVQEVQAPQESLCLRLGLRSSLNEQDLSLETLLPRVFHEQWEERIAAIRALQCLGELMPTEVIHVLCRALTDNVSAVRAAAAQALGDQGRRAPKQALLLTLRDRDGVVRASAIQALGRLGSNIPVETLIRAFHEDDDFSVRLAALSALINIHATELPDLLLEALRDEDACVRAEALQALSTSTPELPFALLLSLLHDEDELVRLHVLDILSTRQEILPSYPIERLLADPSEDVRLASLHLLKQYGDNIPMEHLLLRLKDSSELVREEASLLLGSLVQSIPERVNSQFLLTLLQDEDAQIKALAAWALGEKRERRAQKSLQIASQDASEFVRQAAQWALNEFNECRQEWTCQYNRIGKKSTLKQSAFSQRENDGTSLLRAFMEYLHDKKGYVQPERYSNSNETVLVFLCCFQDEGQSLHESVLQQVDDHASIEDLASAFQCDDDAIQWAMKQITQRLQSRRWSELFLASATILSTDATSLLSAKPAQKIVLCSVSCQQVRKSDPLVLDQLLATFQEHALCTPALQQINKASKQLNEAEQGYDPYSYTRKEGRTRITEPLSTEKKNAFDNFRLWYGDVTETSSCLQPAR